jgi:hypothetical protein
MGSPLAVQTGQSTNLNERVIEATIAMMNDPRAPHIA